MRILFIADVPNWCFDKMGKALQKYGKNEYTIKYGRKDKYKSAFKDCDKFDLILYPVDVRPDYILKFKPPKEKLIMLIRSDVFKTTQKKRIDFYANREILSNRCDKFFMANNTLKDLFESRYEGKFYYAPGGYDSDTFKYEKKNWHTSLVVGWAGSRKNFGSNIRGIGIIEEACKIAGCEFKPAYREDKWRTPEEMAAYYKEIDVFVDLYTAPGRQNGLLEAGACGCPIIGIDAGISRELIGSDNGLIIQRRTRNLVFAINRIRDNLNRYSNNISKEVETNWKWETHVKQWEKYMEECRV